MKCHRNVVSLQPQSIMTNMTDKKKQMIFVGIGAVTGAVVGVVTTFMAKACVQKVKGVLQNRVGENITNK